MGLTEKIKIALESPWKLCNEVMMYAIKPFIFLYLKILGVEIGKGFKFYGFPRVYKTRGSSIKIGKNFEARSWWFSNPLGINHPVIICTWNKNSKIEIGNDVGMSGGSIVSEKGIVIGDRVLIGANSTIIDTDFHPLKGIKRYSKENVKSEKVTIENDVFIGMSSIVLKGARLSANSVVGAGSIVR